MGIYKVEREKKMDCSMAKNMVYTLKRSSQVLKNLIQLIRRSQQNHIIKTCLAPDLQIKGAKILTVQLYRAQSVRLCGYYKFYILPPMTGAYQDSRAING